MFDVARSISSVPAKLPAATERCCAIRAPPSSILKRSKRDPYISIPNSSCLRLRSVKSGSSAANSGASSISFTSAAETSRAIHRNRINPDAIRDWNSRPSAEANAIAVVAGKASSKSSKDIASNITMALLAAHHRPNSRKYLCITSVSVLAPPPAAPSAHNALSSIPTFDRVSISGTLSLISNQSATAFAGSSILRILIQPFSALSAHRTKGSMSGRRRGGLGRRVLIVFETSRISDKNTSSRGCGKKYAIGCKFPPWLRRTIWPVTECTDK